MTKLSVAALSALVLIAAGCAHRDAHRDSGQGQSTTRSAGAVVDDAGLTARVKTAIATDIGAGTAANVNVTTYRGEVQLSGFVDSAERASQAESTARNVPGVQNVKNDLQVKSSASGR
jgi:hyperosmotically inducible periplasmic protein